MPAVTRAMPTATAGAMDTPLACKPNPKFHRWCHGHAPGVQTEPQVEPATSTGIILPETGQFLLLCSLQMWQQLQLQRCHQSRASVQVFSCILLPFNGNSLPGTTRFLGRQTVTSERSRSETHG